MSTLMNKYKMTYNLAQGDALSKVKAVIMHHAAEWELNADSLLADLLDDVQITADDVVDFLATMRDQEEGNEEFRYAVRALQVAQKRSHLQAIKDLIGEELDTQSPVEEEDYLYQQSQQIFNAAEYLRQY